MPDIIKDGTGQGYAARVGSSNRLDASVRQNARIYYASRDNKKAFSVNWAFAQAVGGVTEGMGYLTYTGEGSLIINEVLLSTEEPTTGLTKFGIWVQPTTLSGGDAKVPTNMNLSSDLTSEVTSIHDNDGTGVTITGGSSIYTVRLSGPNSFKVDFASSLIMKNGDTFAIKGNAKTTGTKLRATLLYFEE